MATITTINNLTPVAGLDHNPGIEEVLDATPGYGAFNAKLFEIVNNDAGPYKDFKVQFHSSANGGAGDFNYILIIGSGIQPYGTISGITVRAPDGRVVMEIAPGTAGFYNAKLENFHSKLTDPARTPAEAIANALNGLLGKANLIQGSAAADHLTAFGSEDNALFGNGGDDVLSAPGDHTRTLVGADGDDLIRVEDGAYAVHGGYEDGTGIAGDTDIVEITGYVDDSSYARFDAFTNIDVFRFVAGDRPLPGSTDGAEITAEIYLATGQPGLPGKLRVEGSEKAAPESRNAIAIYADRAADAGAMKLDLSGWTFKNWNERGVFIAGSSTRGLNDVVTGSMVDDQIMGYGGNDVIRGGRGVDALVGGGGNDVFIYGRKEAARGEYVGGGGDDSSADSDIDTIVVRDDNNFAGSYFSDIDRLKFAGKAKAVFDDDVVGNPEALVIGDRKANTLAIALDNKTGDVPAVDLSALKFKSWSGNDAVLIRGTKSQDIITGSSRADTIAGGEGRDSLQGGDGGDAFVFDTAPGRGVDQIADFSRRQGDQIHLDADDFPKLKAAALKGSGVLKTSAFALGFKAEDASDRILYDDRSGMLRYDPDGSGRKGAIVIAELDGGPALRASDFLVL